MTGRMGVDLELPERREPARAANFTITVLAVTARSKPSTAVISPW